MIIKDSSKHTIVFGVRCSLVIIELIKAKLTIPTQNERILTGHTLFSKYKQQYFVAKIKK